MEEKRRRTYRLPPCPPYDVEGMESWLADLGQKGLFLVENGFSGGIATFERREVQWVKYRLEAAQRGFTPWTLNGDEPDPEQLELSQEYGWEYVARRGDFFIFRSFAPGARELNTDPCVQALSMYKVKERQIRSMIIPVVFLALFFYVAWWSGIQITLTTMEWWRFLLTVAVALWCVPWMLLSAIRLGRLRKKLKAGGTLGKKNWRQGQFFYHVNCLVTLVLAVMVTVVFLGGYANRKVPLDQIPISDYTGQLPFASFEDLAGDEQFLYQMEMRGASGFNDIRDWTGVLGVRNIDYNEYATLTFANGTKISGGLYVLYHETMNPAVARGIAEEYERRDRQRGQYVPIELPDLGADLDYGAAYRGRQGYPTVVFQKENVVIQVLFHQWEPEKQLDLAVWAGPIARSIAGA